MEEEGARWLGRWNRSWRAFFFVSGHKAPQESFRQCVVREIREELGLREGPDYRLRPVPAARVTFEAMSRRAGVVTRYEMELLDIELLDSDATQDLGRHPNVRWLKEQEIRAGQCDDGKAVSATMLEVMLRAKLLG